MTTGTQHIEAVSVSRDAKWLAFDSDWQGNSDLYVMPLGGGEPRQVTTDPSYDFHPVWSPDGKELAFHTWRNESRDVFVVPVGGGEEVMAAGGPNMERYPDWSPDGRHIVYSSDAAGGASSSSWTAVLTGAGGCRAGSPAREGPGRECDQYHPASHRPPLVMSNSLCWPPLPHRISMVETSPSYLAMVK